MTPVRGWCPGALRPMESGDGLVVRIRPHGGRLGIDQALGIADLAESQGNGWIDLGSRAHLQLRGVTPATLPAVQAGLAALGLLDPDPGTEARRNILTTPVHGGDDTLAIVAALEAALPGLPPLPPKFGFAVDTGARAVLGAASADIRIERAEGGLILRAGGRALGEPVTVETAVPRACALAHWFAARRGAETRMAAMAALPVAQQLPPLTGLAPAPGYTAFGACRALPFGQIRAETLRFLARGGLRLTPWRSILVEGADLPPHPDLIDDPHDPLLRVAACTGAPGCASATVATRGLARVLAPMVPHGTVLHIAGCTKGCAHPHPAPLTLTGRAGRFDLIRNGRAGDPPALRDLTPEMIPDLMRGPLAP